MIKRHDGNITDVSITTLSGVYIKFVIHIFAPPPPGPGGSNRKIYTPAFQRTKSFYATFCVLSCCLVVGSYLAISFLSLILKKYCAFFYVSRRASFHCTEALFKMVLWSSFFIFGSYAFFHIS